LFPDLLEEALLEEDWEQSLFLCFLLPQLKHSWRRTHPGGPLQEKLFHLWQISVGLPLLRLPELILAAGWLLLFVAWK